MARFKAKKEDIEGFYPKTRLFGEHGNGINKSLDVVTDPIEKLVWYIYSDNRVEVYTGQDLDEAIELFNEQ